jgi:quinol monooxygenase YgiN
MSLPDFMNTAPNTIAVIVQLVVPGGARVQFEQAYERMGELCAQSPGFLSSELGQSTDSLEDFTMIHRWADVGAYRKFLSRYEVKLEVIPFLSTFTKDSVTVEIIMDSQSDRVESGTSSLALDAQTFDRGSIHGER